VGLSINTAWLTLALPLLLSVRSAYDFGQVWMGTMPRPFSEQAVVDALTTEDAQWVAPPFGVQLWVQLTAERGLKATNINRPWFWEDRYPPPPYREGISDRVDLSVPAYVETIEHVHIFEHPENVYACVQAGDDCAPCRATAKGGDIDVECETPVAGMLVVHENMYPGWRASRDGEPAQLGDGQWLTVSAPAGQHSYQFRYRPWDATLGILLTMTGLVVAVWLWRRPPALARTAAAQAFE